MANLAPYPIFQANAGDKLYTYDAGTTTPKATYTTQAGDVSNANPIVFGSNGFNQVWLGDGGYKFVLNTSADVLRWEVDDIGGVSSTAFGAQVFDISSSISVTSSYQNGLLVCTASPTLSLISSVSAGEGFYFSVKNNGVGTVTIDADGAETIDGAASKLLVAGESCLVISNGTNWITSFGLPEDITATSVTATTITGTDVISTDFQAATVGGGALKTSTGASRINWDATAVTLGIKLNANTFKIENLATPTVSTDAATMGYVDTEITSVESSQDTLQTTTSGTSKDFTIPAGTRKITICYNGISTNGTSNVMLQLGDAGGIEATGYLGACGNGTSATVMSTGFLITGGSGITAASVFHGSTTLTLMDSATFLWASSGTAGFSNAAAIYANGGTKATSATATTLRLTTVNGTDTFDAGSVNVIYEK